MKIVHIIDYFQPQLGYQEYYLSLEQAKMGYEVYIITSDRYSPVIYEPNKNLLGSRIKGDGYFEENGVKVWRLKTLFEIPHAIWLHGLEDKIKEIKPDIVIMHGIINIQAIRVGFLKKKLPAFKLIYDDHMTFDNSRKYLGFLYTIFKYSLANVIKRNADSYVAVCEATRQFMYSRYGISKESISVIRLGADDKIFNFDPLSRKEIRKMLSIADDTILFIYAGKVIPTRKLEMIIEAVKLLSSYSQIKVLIIGTGPQDYVIGLKSLIISKGVQGQFLWHEPVTSRELYRYYSAADVAVWTQQASIGQLEAMACGLPLIVDNNSLVTDLINFGNGFSFKRGDAAHLAEQMNKLLEPELRHQMGLNSRKAVEEFLNWHAIAKQFNELIEK